MVMVTVFQLSDTHFGSDGHRSHGGLGYDTDEAFRAAAARMAEAPAPDLVVVTGDLADTGQALEYDKARRALEQLPAPVNVCSGNHDFQVPFEVGLAYPGITMSRTLRLGSWLFVFADSNFTGRHAGPGGRLIDRAERMELANGMLGAAEGGWITDMVEATDAEHVFIWLHHPPAIPGGPYSVPAFDDEVRSILEANPSIRGLGAGHVHTDYQLEIANRPVFVCPALTINIDYEAETLLPPGYRTYRFNDDGSIEGRCELLDDDRWPRSKIPAAGMRFLRGEIGWDEMMEGLGANTGQN